MIVLEHYYNLKKRFPLQNVSIRSVGMFVNAIITNIKHEIWNSLSKSFCPTISLYYIYQQVRFSEWISDENDFLVA